MSVYTPKIAIMNPKDSNIYRKTQFELTYDSKGVERGLKYDIFYKHTILSGLKSHAFLLQVIEKEFRGKCRYTLKNVIIIKQSR